jgi:hypothetical protein
VRYVSFTLGVIDFKMLSEQVCGGFSSGYVKWMSLQVACNGSVQGYRR